MLGEIAFDVVLARAEVREFFGEMRRYDRDAVGVTDDHVARLHLFYALPLQMSTFSLVVIVP